MANEPLYMKDCYLRNWKTRVKSVKDRFVVLEDTAFYPKAGGQPWDTGTIKRLSDGMEFRVLYAGRFSGEISQELDQEGLMAGDEVECDIDWERRYLFMRYHTAAHVLSKVIYNETGAVISGNQLGADKSRIDFTIEQFDREKAQEWVNKTNNIISGGREVKIEFMPFEKAVNIPDFVRTRADLLKKINVLRVINIVGLDQQACGGTHLRNIKEIGTISLLKIENKGKNNRRIYFSIE
jgi:Ser-tRNA(Ala) deacylase AlaX